MPTEPQHQHVVKPRTKKVARRPAVRANFKGRLYRLGKTDGSRGPREHIAVEIPSEPGPERSRVLDAIYSVEDPKERFRKQVNDAALWRRELAEIVNEAPRHSTSRVELISTEWIVWTTDLAYRAFEALESSLEALKLSGVPNEVSSHVRQYIRHLACRALRLSHEYLPDDWIQDLNPLPQPLKKSRG